MKKCFLQIALTIFTTKLHDEDPYFHVIFSTADKLVIMAAAAAPGGDVRSKCSAGGHSQVASPSMRRAMCNK